MPNIDKSNIISPNGSEDKNLDFNERLSYVWFTTIKKALKLLKKYDYKFIKVSRAMNIKVKILRSWHKKEKDPDLHIGDKPYLSEL